MTTQELRELGAFCATEVMGFNPVAHPSRAGDCIIYSNGLVMLPIFPTRNMRVWSPTTDPAAAMDVLKKCSLHFKKVICICPCPEGFEVYLAAGDYARTTQRAATLELAICLFCKKLYENSNPSH